MTHDEKEQIKEMVKEVVGGFREELASKEDLQKSHIGLAGSISGFGDQINRLSGKQPQTLLDKLVHYWPLVLGILFVIVAFVRFGFNDGVMLDKISVVEARTSSLEQSVTELTMSHNQFLSELALVRNDVSWIKNRLMK